MTQITPLFDIQRAAVQLQGRASCYGKGGGDQDNWSRGSPYLVDVPWIIESRSGRMALHLMENEMDLAE